MRANEQDSYQSSLKYYRDLNNVIDTSRQEGLQEGLEQGRIEGAERERLLINRLLIRTVGVLPLEIQQAVNGLSLEQLEALSESLLAFETLEALVDWLNALSLSDGEAFQGNRDTSS